MKVEYYREYSPTLNRDMEFKVYGHAGKPCLVFPCQDGRFFDFENRGMTDLVSNFIDSGRLQLFCCDSIDLEHVSDLNGDNGHRSYMLEQYYHYICDELVPMIFDINAEGNGGNYASGICTAGCSMGGAHSANFALRRPDIFDSCIAMSGLFDLGYFFNGYMDERVYNNSPIQYIEGMPNDHYYVDLYRKNKLIMVCGQGNWEHPMIEDHLRLKELLGYKGVNASIDLWGPEYPHDWPSWEVYWPHYLEYVC